MHRKKRLSKRADQQRAQRIITAPLRPSGWYAYTPWNANAALGDGGDDDCCGHRWNLEGGTEEAKNEARNEIQFARGRPRISDWNQNRIVVLNNLWGMFSLLAIT
jgi:hypothetical protein